MIIDNNLLVEQVKLLSSNVLIQIFLIFVAFDIISGTAKGLRNENLNSRKGVNGVVKHFLVIILVLVTIPYLELLGFHTLGLSLKIFFIAQYGISIIENLGHYGIKLPSWIKKKFEQLHEQNDEIEGDVE